MNALLILEGKQSHLLIFQVLYKLALPKPCLTCLPFTLFTLGYERLRNKCWEDHRNSTRAIVFVIDSFQISSNIRDVTDYLYSILADRVVLSKRLPILIACNKQDKPKSKSSKVISSMLEKEITAIRETRLNALESTERDREDSSKILGSLEREFTFNDVKNRIDFVDCTAYLKEDSPAQIDDIICWLNKV